MEETVDRRRTGRDLYVMVMKSTDDWLSVAFELKAEKHIDNNFIVQTAETELCYFLWPSPFQEIQTEKRCSLWFLISGALVMSGVTVGALYFLHKRQIAPGHPITVQDLPAVRQVPVDMNTPFWEQ